MALKRELPSYLKPFGGLGHCDRCNGLRYHKYVKVSGGWLCTVCEERNREKREKAGPPVPPKPKRPRPGP